MKYPILKSLNSWPSLAVVAVLFIGCSGGSDGSVPTTGCTPGTSTGCAAGQVCSAAGVCETLNTTSGTLAINAAAARSCEVLLESSSTRIEGATFGAGVQGAFRKRPPRYAIAITQTGNQAFGDGAVTLQLVGDAGAVSVGRINCFGDDGALIVDASATVR